MVLVSAWEEYARATRCHFRPRSRKARSELVRAGWLERSMRASGLAGPARLPLSKGSATRPETGVENFFPLDRSDSERERQMRV